MKVIRWIVLFVVIISAPAVARAQYKNFVFGFKAAPGIGWVRTDTKDYTGGSSITFSWGFVSEFNFSENYCISTGINFVFNNGQITYPDLRNEPPSRVTVDRKLRVKYLQIPVTLKMRTEEKNNMRLFGQFGLGTGFRLSAQGKDEYVSATSGTIAESQNIDDDISFLRESLIVGFGMEYRIGSGNMISAGLTLDNGFTDILSSSNKVDPSMKPKGTSSLVEMSVAIMF